MKPTGHAAMPESGKNQTVGVATAAAAWKIVATVGQTARTVNGTRMLTARGRATADPAKKSVAIIGPTARIGNGGRMPTGAGILTEARPGTCRALITDRKGLAEIAAHIPTGGIPSEAGTGHGSASTARFRTAITWVRRAHKGNRGLAALTEHPARTTVRRRCTIRGRNSICATRRNLGGMPRQVSTIGTVELARAEMTDDIRSLAGMGGITRRILVHLPREIAARISTRIRRRAFRRRVRTISATDAGVVTITLTLAAVRMAHRLRQTDDALLPERALHRKVEGSFLVLKQPPV